MPDDLFCWQLIFKLLSLGTKNCLSWGQSQEPSFWGPRWNLAVSSVMWSAQPVKEGGGTPLSRPWNPAHRSPGPPAQGSHGNPSHRTRGLESVLLIKT